MSQHVWSSHGRRRQRQPILTPLLFAAWLGACGDSGAGDSASVCLPEPQVACSPGINTDFTSIHRSVLSQRCGTSGNSCHGPDGHQGNLVLSDPDTAYSALLGINGGPSRVVPGDPDCSVLMERLESDDPGQRMPLGESKLNDGLRCAVRRWIEEGAAR